MVYKRGLKKGLSKQGNFIIGIALFFFVFLILIISSESVSAEVADPTQLPEANGQTTPSGLGTTMRGTAAGSTYLDPTTGVTVLRLTDSSTPFSSNSRGVPDYSEGGPFISQAWSNATGTYYTLYVMVDSSPSTHYLVDLKYSDMTLHRWRQFTNMENTDLMWAWSLDPATPRIGYGLGMPSRNVLRKFNTSSMTEVTGGNFPKTLPEASTWLSGSVNDSWFSFMDRTGGARAYAWNPNTDVLHTWAFSFNEPHLDKDGAYVYVVTTGSYCGLGNANILRVFKTSDGAEFQPAPDVPDWPTCNNGELWNTHITTLRNGRMVTNNPNEGAESTGTWEYFYDPSTDNVTLFRSRASTYTSSSHRSGIWVFNNNDEYYALSPWGGTGALRDALGFVSTDSSKSVRLLGHHGSVVTGEYFSQPHATVSPDGKLVMWGSTMGVSGGRIDAFVVSVPTTDTNDTTPPVRSSGLPSGSLPGGLTNLTLSLSTDETSTCKYGTTSDVAYASITNAFTTTGSTSHNQLITGITDNTTYNYYIRCQDSSSNANTNDFTISFTTGIMPLLTYNWTEWYTNETTNLSNFNSTHIQNISNVKFSNDFGVIHFLQALNISQDRNLVDRIKVAQNRIQINSSLIPEFNKSAQLTFRGVTLTNPVIKRDGGECSISICTATSFNSNTKIFLANVTAFSLYELEEAPAESGNGGGGSGGGGGGGGSPTATQSQTVENATVAEPVLLTGFDEITGIKQIILRVKNDTQNIQITVKRFDSNPTSIEPERPVSHYLQFTTVNLDSNLDKATVNFFVEKSWMSENQVDVNDIALFKFDEASSSWKGLSTSYMEEDENYYYYDSEITSFSFFAISGLAVEEEGEKADRLGLAFWILVAVVTVIVVLLIVWWRKRGQGLEQGG